MPVVLACTGLQVEATRCSLTRSRSASGTKLGLVTYLAAVIAASAAAGEGAAAGDEGVGDLGLAETRGLDGGSTN